MSGRLQDKELPLMEHFKDLRKRLIISFVALAVTTGVCMAFAEKALQIIIRPLGGIAPQTIAVTESFVVYFKVALVGGLALASPVIVYEIVMFILPGLLPHERKYLYFLIPGVFICFILGVLFAGFVMLPAAINFMQGFLTTIVENRWTLDNYVSFVTQIMLAMGVVFQLPLVLYFLAKLGIVNTKQLGQFRKWAFLCSAIIAAMVTPTPDPVNMTIVMLSLYALYEVGVFMTRFARPQKSKEEQIAT